MSEHHSKRVAAGSAEENVLFFRSEACRVRARQRGFASGAKYLELSVSKYVGLLHILQLYCLVIKHGNGTSTIYR